MKKRLTKGEKWLFASPLLFLFLAGLFWQRQKTAPISFDFPVSVQADELEFSPDGKRLMAFFRDSSSYQRFGRVYDLESRSPLCDFATLRRHPNDLADSVYPKPAWSSDGKSIASAMNHRHSSVGTLQIWDTQTGTAKAEFSYETSEEGSTSIRFDSDGKTLIAEGDSSIRYDAETGQLLGKPKAISDDDSLNEKLGLLASTSQNNKNFRVVDTKTGRPVFEPQIWEVPEFEWAGDILFVRGYRRTGHDRYETSLLLWDGKTRQLLPSPPILSDAELHDFSFNSDKTTFTYIYYKARWGGSEKSTDFDSELVSWDYRKNRVAWRYEIPTALSSIQWSPDGRLLKVLAGTDEEFQNRLLIFDKSGNLQLERQPVRRKTCWSDDSKQLAFEVSELDKPQGKIISNRLEIHRFED